MKQINPLWHQRSVGGPCNGRRLRVGEKREKAGNRESIQALPSFPLFPFLSSASVPSPRPSIRPTAKDGARSASALAPRPPLSFPSVRRVVRPSFVGDLHTSCTGALIEAGTIEFDFAGRIRLATQARVEVSSQVWVRERRGEMQF